MMHQQKLLGGLFIALLVLFTGISGADEAQIKKDILNVLWLPSSARLPADISLFLIL